MFWWGFVIVSLCVYTPCALLAECTVCFDSRTLLLLSLLSSLQAGTMRLIFRRPFSWWGLSVLAWSRLRWAEKEQLLPPPPVLSLLYLLFHPLPLFLPLSHTQQQYKFVYMAIKHYVESQQALMNVVRWTMAIYSSLLHDLQYSG